MVTWLKVALPLMALGLLSTLFLISRAVDPPSTIPFADTEVQERLTNQQVTGPYFSGTSDRGDQIAFVADTVTSPDGKTGTNTAKTVDVQVDMPNGTRITVTAHQAVIDIAKDHSELTGDVEIITSEGYILRSDLLDIRMSALDITSPDQVFAVTPVGDIEAGSMHLFAAEGSNDAQLVFTNGVKLLYQPEKSEE
ncbi:LPS export ABC transporter periplasmic protein LptC [Roseobacter weihaiensis]|uniref:LPS export ABC transporter periplasmic protein LptC n=1 Tax=Roseobacter weihaiensis TaxID=2763262 RepID=UPI001D09E324|nr:LPS export ABC transporter periplasmic protein LptC [Roseobacter sp. H9]